MTLETFRMRMLLLGWDETLHGMLYHYVKGNRNANIHPPEMFDPTLITEDSEGQTTMMILKNTQELFDLILDIEERDDFGSYSEL